MNLRTLLHNIRYFSTVRIENIYWENIKYTKEAIKYGNLLSGKDNTKIQVLNSEQSLDLLMEKPKSFYRFGDGEIQLMTGGNAGTQEYNPVLADKLLKALTDINIDAYIGIGYEYFHFDLWGENEFANRFYLLDSEQYRNFYIDHCNSNCTYIDTGFSQRYFSLSDAETENWFARLRSLFADKNITLFMGKQAYNNLGYYIFDSASKVNVEFCPSKNAFNDYDRMMAIAKKLPKNELICLAVGATAKVMAYELTKEGYLVYDIGHMPKDYDSYMKKIVKTKESAEEFYREDYRLK